MNLHPELSDRLQFLLIELQKQLQGLIDYIETADEHYIQKSLTRIDYIDNFYVNLLNQTIAQNCETSELTSVDIQSYQNISHQLKHCSSQFEQIATPLKADKVLKLLGSKQLNKGFEKIALGIEMTLPAMEREDSQIALDLTQLKPQIDALADSMQKRIKERLATGQQINALLSASFVVRDLSNIGQTLLRIGEAIISANLGQMIELDRYHSLEATLANTHLADNDLNINPISETKSGCRISSVIDATDSTSDGQTEQILAVFKDGDPKKLKQEKQGIESWHKKYPGIAPEVYAYHKANNQAALLFEFMTGSTFDKLIVENNMSELKIALNALFETLEHIWQETIIEERHPAFFMKQLKNRLKGVYDIHPEFNLKGLSLGDFKQDSLEQLIEKAETVEANLAVPHAIFIHGDFNLDNILYDAQNQQISFIDLHRSEYLDYVQDLSVLIVSCYRLKDFNPKVRKRISKTMKAIYDFGENIAHKNSDKSYHQRMALGLARSFISSTRFILDKEHAKKMHYKGRFLIEQITLLSPNKLNKFKVPKELFNE